MILLIGIKYMASVNELALPHHQFPTSCTIYFYHLFVDFYFILVNS